MPLLNAFLVNCSSFCDSLDINTHYFYFYFIYFFLKFFLIYVRCGGSLLLCMGFSSRGFSYCWARARFLRCSGLAGLQHVESSRSRNRTHVPCVGRQTLNHCATREVPHIIFKGLIFNSSVVYYLKLWFLLSLFMFVVGNILLTVSL